MDQSIAGEQDILKPRRGEIESRQYVWPVNRQQRCQRVNKAFQGFQDPDKLRRTLSTSPAQPNAEQVKNAKRELVPPANGVRMKAHTSFCTQL